MSRRIYASILLAVVLASAIILWQRHMVERNNKQVALFMDGTDLLYRSRALELDLAAYLLELKQAGLYGIASHVVPLHEMETQGDIVLASAGLEATQLAQSFGLPTPHEKQSIIEIKAEHLLRPIQLLLQKLEAQITVYGDFIYTNLDYERLRRASLGFPEELIKAVDEAGLAFLPVFSPYSGSSVLEFAQYLQTREFAGVMFTGNRLAENLDGAEELARVINEKNLTMYWLQRSDTLRGYVPLEGVERILSQQSKIVRSYRISRAETDNPLVNPDNMVFRWLGSIKEYNTRAIYMRPFFREPDISYNSNYVRLLVTAVKRAGYTLGPAEPYARYYPFFALQLFVGIGIGLLAFTVALHCRLPRPLAYLGFVATILAQAALLTPYATSLRLGLGLVGAIMASFAGIALFTERKNPWQAFFAVQTATVAFALLTASYLSDYDFITEFQFFRGVKLQYTLPLVLQAALLWLPRWRKLRFDVVDIARQIGWWVVAGLVLAAGGALFFYIRRSGHVHSVSQVELYLRFWLDEVLIARPRFKELIAHPVLLLVLYYRPRLPRLVYEIGLVAAAIGQVSIVNTFMHLRTPLALSLLRVFHGLWIGILFGLLAIAMVEAVRRVWAKAR